MSLLKILHTFGISHFWHLVFRLHWWAKAAVGAGRVSQWVSGGRRAPSYMQRTDAAQDCGWDRIQMDWFSTKKGGRGERSLWLVESLTLNLRWKKKKQDQTTEFWMPDTEKKNPVLSSCLRRWCHQCALPAGSHKKRKGKKMNVTPSGCSIYCLSGPNPAGSVFHSGFMSSVVAPISWCLSCCQYFWCPKSGRKHTGGCRNPSDRS